MKQQINEIRRMQELAGILNEETEYTDEQIAAALKSKSIVTDDEYGDRWAVTIGKEENGKKQKRIVWRDTQESAKIVMEKLKTVLSGATLGVVDTLAKYK